MPEPIVVRSVKGFIYISRFDPAEPLSDVLFEIKTGTVEIRIRKAITNDKGKFRIPNVPEGTYSFKATKDGFQSILGTVIVSKKAKRKSTIMLHMPLGV